MRTTINLDDDILDAAKSLADQRGLPVGKVVSNLVREALAPYSVNADDTRQTRNGIGLFPVNENAGVVTPEIVQELLEETE